MSKIKIKGVDLTGTVEKKEPKGKGKEDKKSSSAVQAIADKTAAQKEAVLSGDPEKEAAAAMSSGQQSEKIEIPDENPAFLQIMQSKAIASDDLPIRLSTEDLSMSQGILRQLQEARDKLAVPALLLSALDPDKIDCDYCDPVDDIVGALSRFGGVEVPHAGDPKPLSEALSNVKETHGLKQARACIDGYDCAKLVLHTRTYALYRASDSSEPERTGAYFALYLKNCDARMYIPAFGNTLDLGEGGADVMTKETVPGAFVNVTNDADANDRKDILVTEDPERMAAEIGLAIRPQPSEFGRTTLRMFGATSKELVAIGQLHEEIRVGSVDSNGSVDARTTLETAGFPDGRADGLLDLTVLPNGGIGDQKTSALRLWLSMSADPAKLTFVQDSPISVKGHRAIAELDVGTLADHIDDWAAA